MLQPQAKFSGLAKQLATSFRSLVPEDTPSRCLSTDAGPEELAAAVMTSGAHSRRRQLSNSSTYPSAPHLVNRTPRAHLLRAWPPHGTASLDGPIFRTSTARRGRKIRRAFVRLRPLVR